MHPLDLGSLSPVARRWAVAGLGVALLAAVLIVAVGAGWRPPGGTQGDHAVPRLVLVFTIAALAAIGALVTVAGRHDGWRVPFAARLAVGFVGAAVAAGCVGIGRDLGAAAPQVLGWAGVALAATLVVLPHRWFGRRHALAAAVGASPFLLAGVAYAAGPNRDALAAPIVTAALDLAVAVGVLLVWAVVESVRLGRDYGLLLAPTVRAASWLLPLALALKVAWIALGYAGELPRWFGGASGNWSESLHNGAFGWAYAVAFVALAGGALLLRGRVDTERLDGALAGVVAALVATTLVFTVVVLAIEIALPWAPAGVEDALGRARDHLVEIRVLWWTQAAAVGAAALAGLALLRRHRAAALLLTVAAWGIPPAIVRGWILVENSAPPFVPTKLATLDTVATAALAVLAARRLVEPGAALVALVVFTLVGHPGVLLPAGWRNGTLFYLALVFPVAWRYLVRAQELNRHVAERPARVLGAVAVSALLLVAAAVNVAVGLARGNVLGEFLDQTGRVFVMAPFALLVAVEALRRRDGVRPGA